MKLRLRDFLSVEAKSKIKAGDGRIKGDYKFFTSSPVQSKFINSWLYDAEALVFGTGGNASVHYVNDKFSTSTDCLVMTNKMPNEVNLKCIYYFLAGNIHLLAAGFKGCGLQHISKDFILNLKIDLPERDVQDEIVAVFDLLTTVRIGKEKQLQKFDDLVKSQFIEMFGGSEYPEQTLSECCTFIDYRGKTPEKASSGIRLITAKNVRMHYLKDEPAEYVPARNYDAIMTRGIPPLGSILFTTEAPLGNVCRIPNYQEKFCIGQRLLNIIPRKELNSLYLEYQLGSEAFQNEMRKKSSGSTVTGIRAKELIKLKIPVPPLELQNEFARFVEQTDKSKDVEELEVAA